MKKEEGDDDDEYDDEDDDEDDDESEMTTTAAAAAAAAAAVRRRMRRRRRRRLQLEPYITAKNAHEYGIEWPPRKNGNENMRFDLEARCFLDRAAPAIEIRARQRSTNILDFWREFARKMANLVADDQGRIHSPPRVGPAARRRAGAHFFLFLYRWLAVDDLILLGVS